MKGRAYDTAAHGTSFTNRSTDHHDGGSGSFTVGAIGNRGSGFVRFGQNEHGATVDGALLLRDGHHADSYQDDYYSSYVGFPAGNYYSSVYTPYFYPQYGPYLGYSYVSPYYSSRYAFDDYAPDYYASSDPAYYTDSAPFDLDAPVTRQQLVGPPPSYSAQAETETDSYIGEGNTAFASGNYDDARRWYVQAILADERDGQAKLLYAVANFAVRDYDVAATALKRALQSTPALLDYPVDVRQLYVRRSTWEQQLAHLQNYVATHAADSDVLFLLAYLHYTTGDPANAAIVNNTAHTIAPNNTLVDLLADAITRVTAAKQ